MSTYILRDVPPSVWSRMGRAMAWRDLARRAAVIEAVEYWCEKQELDRRNQQGGDTVAPVPMGAHE